MGGAIKAFAEFPDQYARLRGDPSLIRTAIEEIVRWTTPSIYKRRTATRDVEFCGAALLEGEKITVWEMSANRDEKEFEEPFRFDVSRTPNRHLGFGAGVHFCLGANLARLEARVAIDALLDKFGGWTPDLDNAERIHTSTVRGYRRLPVCV